MIRLDDWTVTGSDVRDVCTELMSSPRFQEVREHSALFSKIDVFSSCYLKKSVIEDWMP